MGRLCIWCTIGLLAATAAVVAAASLRIVPAVRDDTMLVLTMLLFVASALLLLFLVLLHSGKGGGLSDMFGGSLGATAAGSTVVEKNLDRITVVVALAFIFTSVSLALLLV